MPELRADPLTGRWILIATDRSRRPNDFSAPGGPCPFCPGHESETPPPVLVVPQSGGGGWQIRVTPNKFPAITVDGPAYGAHEVIIEAPEHDLSFADFESERLHQVLEVYEHRIRALKSDPRLQYAFLFKNHGEWAGASRIHPHSQLIAAEKIPLQVQNEWEAARRHGRCPACEALNDAEHLVLQTHTAAVICPGTPRFPFETWLLPTRHASHFQASAGIAEALHAGLNKLRRVTGLQAYNLGLHIGPLQAAELPYVHWRLEIIPRLSRLAGFELGTGVYIHEISPEQAVKSLRAA